MVNAQPADLRFPSNTDKEIDMQKEKLQSIGNYAFLHVVYLIYSITSVCSKSAAVNRFLSSEFLLYLGLLILTLGVYALLWQQVIKRFPLTKAYSNKGAVVIWNMIWAALLFGETINLYNVFGAFVIVAGIAVVSSDGS